MKNLDRVLVLGAQLGSRNLPRKAERNLRALKAAVGCFASVTTLQSFSLAIDLERLFNGSH